MLACPHLPACQHLGCQLPGARMLLKRVLNRLEHACDWGFCTGQRVRDRCSCQYISGSNISSTHCVHLGGMAMCSKSCHTLCHQKSIRAEMPASCLRSLSKVSFFTGNLCVSSNVSSP